LNVPCGTPFPTSGESDPRLRGRFETGWVKLAGFGQNLPSGSIAGEFCRTPPLDADCAPDMQMVALERGDLSPLK